MPVLRLSDNLVTLNTYFAEGLVAGLCRWQPQRLCAPLNEGPPLDTRPAMPIAQNAWLRRFLFMATWMKT